MFSLPDPVASGGPLWEWMTRFCEIIHVRTNVSEQLEEHWLALSFWRLSRAGETWT